MVLTISQQKDDVQNILTMKQIFLLIFVGNLFLGCQPKLFKSHPECTDYFNYVKEHWSKKDNNFFKIKEVIDTSAMAWAHLDDPPHFYQEWKKNYQCICALNEKEVVQLFGKPTRVSNTYNVVKKVTTQTYGYHISDGHCEEVIVEKNNWQICSFLAFTFWKGEQNRRYTEKPRLNIYGYNFFPPEG